MAYSVCDKCGELVADIDAGFSPGLHRMGCKCGGTWQVVVPCPKCHDEQHQQYKGSDSVGSVRIEYWNCANPYSRDSIERKMRRSPTALVFDGCGSHTQVVVDGDAPAVELGRLR
jgi:hypothetical protein